MVCLHNLFIPPIRKYALNQPLRSVAQLLIGLRANAEYFRAYFDITRENPIFFFFNLCKHEIAVYFFLMKPCVRVLSSLFPSTKCAKANSAKADGARQAPQAQSRARWVRGYVPPGKFLNLGTVWWHLVRFFFVFFFFFFAGGGGGIFLE